MSWMTKWFINNPVAANLLMMIVISGVLAFGQHVESFPQIAPSSISITVAYPGGTAQHQIDECKFNESKSRSVALLVSNRSPANRVLACLGSW